MLNTTLPKLRCPSCTGALQVLNPRQTASGEVIEITSGELQCSSCSANYPILAGVALLVTDVHSYLVEHVKGISQVVADSDIPAAFRSDYLEAKEEIEIEHIEEDLEADRVISLYLANHYLNTSGEEWWKPQEGYQSTLISSLIREHWDHGPFATIGAWVDYELNPQKQIQTVVELGCGVGGLSQTLKGRSCCSIARCTSPNTPAIFRCSAMGGRGTTRFRMTCWPDP